MEYWPSWFPNPSQQYSVQLESNLLRTPQASGRFVQRNRFTRNLQTYQVVWQLTDNRYEAFESWRFIKLNNGVDWFYINLVQGGGFKQVKARIVKGSYSANYIDGNSEWEISCILEVEDIPRLTEYELDAVLILGDSTIDELEAAIAAQEQFYNVDIYTTYNFEAL